MDASVRSHTLDINLHFDFQERSVGRVIGMTICPDLPDVLAHRWLREGLQRNGTLWVGPVTSFKRAFVALPDEWSDLRTRAAALLNVRLASRRSPDSKNRTLVMGVLNVTPDSFYDGGRYADADEAVLKAKQMVAEGADMIDVGGESTRPGARPVSAEEELRRILPVIKAVSGEIDVPVSVDTYKGVVAQKALKAGARIVNDISGLQYDPRMARIVAEAQAGLIIMHTQGMPRTMQRNPFYNDVVEEVRNFLARRCDIAMAAGVDAGNIWIDPGIGFGKTVTHNLTLMTELRAFRSLGFPVMIGTSNKSMIGHVLNVDVDERTEGTAATVALAIHNGADAVRVHDVKTMKRVVTMTDAVVRGWTGG